MCSGDSHWLLVCSGVLVCSGDSTNPNQTKRFYHGLIPLDDANGIANSEDSDQTAPLGAVWSGSSLFAQTYLSENLGSLR